MVVAHTNTVVIHIALLNEGTDVLRPTTGLVVRPGVVRVLATSDYDPAAEEWEFPPGSEVQCQTEMHSGRKVLVARRPVA
jgi:hypothetical protein